MGQRVGKAVGERGKVIRQHRAPPKAIETIVAILIPPASREEVLGDLHERCTSTVQYVLDALGVLPLVIMSRIRRTTDSQVVLMQAFVLYLSYLGAAWFQDKSLLREDRALLRLAITPALILAFVILEDAYASPGKRSSLKTMRGLILGIVAAWLVQLMLTSMHSALALPPLIEFAGSSVCLLLGSAVRLFFPPITDRPAGANGPALWLKHGGGEPDIAGAATATLKSLGLIVGLALLGAWIGGTSLMRSLIWLSAIALLLREVGRRI